MFLSICRKQGQAVERAFPVTGWLCCLPSRCFRNSWFMHIKSNTSRLVFHDRMGFEQSSVGAYWLSRWEQRNDSPELVKYRNQHGWEASGCNKLHTHHKCAKPYFCIACICNDLPTGCFKVVAKANFKYPLT